MTTKTETDESVPPRLTCILIGSKMKAFLSHSSADKERYVGIVASRLAEEDIVYDEVSFESGNETTASHATS